MARKLQPGPNVGHEISLRYFLVDFHKSSSRDGNNPFPPQPGCDDYDIIICTLTKRYWASSKATPNIVEAVLALDCLLEGLTRHSWFHCVEE